MTQFKGYLRVEMSARINTLVVLCERQDNHGGLQRFIQQDENVEELEVYRRAAGFLEFSVTYKNDASAKAAKSKLEREGAEVLASFDRYRLCAGLPTQPAQEVSTPSAEEEIDSQVTTVVEDPATEEVIGLRIYTLRPDEEDPRSAIIIYEDIRSTPIIRSIIAKEKPTSISLPIQDRNRFLIRASFETVDRCIMVLMKYLNWAHVRGEEEEEENNDVPQSTPPPGETKRLKPLLAIPWAHRDPQELWEERRLAELEERIRQGKRMEHADGLRINILIRIKAAETTALMYFCKFGHVDYYQTIPIGNRGVHQIFIKYFRKESVDRALKEADPCYGVRRSNPPVVPGNQTLLHYHAICRRYVNHRMYMNHQRVCRWQVGSETLTHKACGRPIRRRSFSRHLQNCCQTFDYVGIGRAPPTLKETSQATTSPSTPDLQIEELITSVASVVLDSDNEDINDYHTPDLSMHKN